MGIFKRKDSNAPDGKAAGKIRNSRFAASLGILKNNQFVLSVLAVLLGVVFLIWPDILLTILVRFIGAVFILGGIVAVVMFFTSRERMIMHSIVLGVGVVMAVIGVWILISPEFLITLMPKIIGLLLLICGITSFTGTVTLARRSYSRWWISLLLSIGILAAADPAFRDRNAVREDRRRGIHLYGGSQSLDILQTEPPAEDHGAGITGDRNAGRSGGVRTALILL